MFIMDSGHVVLSAKTPDRLGRIGSENKENETFTESEA